MAWKIPLYKTYVTNEEKNQVNKIINRKSYWADGPENKELEKIAAKISGRKYCLSFNSGTSALHAMMIAYGIKQNDEVIVPSFTFIATANAPLFVGAKPVFADIEKETFALDPDSVKKQITKRTKAIIPVHYGGCPALKINELKELAEDKGILMLEDAAEAFGAEIDGKKVGSFGDASMFSLCGNKVITSGEGGLVVTDNKEIFHNLYLIRSHGRNDDGNYFNSAGKADYVTLGYNFRMPTIVAALAIAQVKKMEKIIAMRRAVAKQFDKTFSQYDIRIPLNNKQLYNIYQMYPILLANKNMRDALKNHLNAAGIQSKIYFDPVHQTHFYKNVLGVKARLNNTEEISGRILNIPIYPGMTNKDINYICGSIDSFMGQ